MANTAQPKPADDSIFDKRAVAIGLLVSVALGAGSLVWRFTQKSDTWKKPEEFQFSVAEPKPEEFKVTDPERDIIKERPEEMKPSEVLKDERPDIHMSTQPVEIESATEVVKSQNVEVVMPKIDVSAKDIDIQDAPLEISQVSETVTHALNAIAADSPAPADLFKYDQPSPRDQPKVHHINSAPRPSKALSALPKAFGDQDAPTSGPIGPMDVNLNGTGEFMSAMSPAGALKARTAVDAALHWLALHQGADGMWLANAYEGGEAASLADTALACLAFMGGGHNTRRGEYRRNVIKGMDAILRCQDKDGRFAWKGSNLYTHAICAIAVCEVYGRVHDDAIASAAQRGIDYCIKAVNTDGGWRYKPQDEMSDTSVTAWFVQALKTAKLAQVKFDPALFSQALAYLDTVTDQGAAKESTGVVGYTYQADQKFPDNRHPALTCAGMVIRQFNGMGVKSHLLVKGAQLTQKKAPQWNQKDFYYWYYATYAMHNMGGEHRIWWNQKIRDVLLEHQSRDGDHAGSWDPKGDRWGAEGGRVYTTALGALCLEVYYRYSEALNSFGTAPDLDELFFQGQ